MAIGVLACCLVFVAPGIARADDDAPKQAPRTAITIGGASVVLVAANNKLYAFVDRIEDNAPIKDAELSVFTSEGNTIDMTKAPITMNKATEGLFVGPLNRVGQMQGAFMVTLQSAEGSGDAQAEIIYADVRPPSAVSTVTSPTLMLAIAGVSGAIGATIATLTVFWWRGVRRRGTAGSIGAAPVT